MVQEKEILATSPPNHQPTLQARVWQTPNTPTDSKSGKPGEENAGGDGSPYGSLEVILFQKTWGIAVMPIGLFKGKA